MPSFVKVGGVWRNFAPKVRVSGAWHDMVASFVRAGGTWRQTYNRDYLDTQSLITGVSGTTPNRLRGFLSGTMGQVLDGSSNLYAGNPQVAQLLHNEATGQIVFSIFGTYPNSGWGWMYIGGQVYSRAGGTFTQGGGQSYWIWNGPYFGDNATAIFTP